MTTSQPPILKKIDDQRFLISRDYKRGMNVDAVVYIQEKMIPDLRKDKCLEQIVNVAHLPGVVKYVLAMPDMHWGYGFPIGGVAATDIDKNGVVSPGGVGFDINCGVRLLKTGIYYSEAKDRIEELVNGLYHHVPAGVGSTGSIRVSTLEEKKILLKGAGWAVSQGYGCKEDLEFTEENGCLSGADPDKVFDHAFERGRDQSGTLGSGNHFLEIQEVVEIYDAQAAECYGLELEQIVIMIHTGSRGFGHQVCTDYAKSMLACLKKYDISVPDRQLACAPVKSDEGRAYLSAMACAANYAWANRQIIMHRVREVFEKVFKQSWEKLGMRLVYDVAHNIAKIENHCVDGKMRNLCVHRKGATRAFGPGHLEIPEKYRLIGQPVIIPGDMGRASYLLAGTAKAMADTFGSTCHGAGRLKSRTEAIRTLDPRKILDDLQKKGIIVRASSKHTIAEEAPQAYKDVNNVVDIVHNAGISKKICRMRPLAVVKG